MGILIVTSALVVVGASLWWVFRRPSRLYTTKDLPPAAEGIEIAPQLTEQERASVKAAFLSGDDFRWMTAGKDYRTELDPGQHERLTAYMMDCMMSFCQHYGVLVVCRSKGEFMGLVGLIPPYKSNLLFMLHFIRCVLPYGKPVPKQFGKAVSARFDAFTRTIEKESGEILNGIPHWYAGVVAVAPGQQGQGVGRKLVQAAIALAGDTPLALETHDENVGFYEKLGFVVKKRFELVPEGIEDATSFPYNCLVHGL